MDSEGCGTIGGVCKRCGVLIVSVVFFFQAEDGIRDLVRSRGLGDVYKRQPFFRIFALSRFRDPLPRRGSRRRNGHGRRTWVSLSLIHI